MLRCFGRRTVRSGLPYSFGRQYSTLQASGWADHLGNLGLHHFGEYDWLSIGEFPNHRADLAVLIAGVSKGRSAT